MKLFLFICLFAFFSCNEAIDVAKCLLEIPGYKDAVEKVVESIKTKNIKEIYSTVRLVVDYYKGQAIDCINKINDIKGLICKHPIKNFECLVKCGLPDDSPRYCNCYSKCRDEFCL